MEVLQGNRGKPTGRGAHTQAARGKPRWVRAFIAIHVRFPGNSLANSSSSQGRGGGAAHGPSKIALARAA